MENKIKISIIIVIYKGQPYLKSCLDSIFDNVKGVNLEVIIVNNNPQKLDLSDSDPRIKIINAGQNLGFGRGHNLGAKSASGEILWLLNTDTEILAGDIREIIREFIEKGEMGITGARLIGENNKEQEWSTGVESTLWDLIKNNLGIKSSRKIWESKKKKEADWVSGTSLFIRKELFEKIGGFDEKFFMYFEDIDLCKRVREAGYKVIYFPEFVIKHFGGKSFESSTLQKKYYYQSQDYYFEKHFGKLKSGLVKLLRKLFIFK